MYQPIARATWWYQRTAFVRGPKATQTNEHISHHVYTSILEQMLNSGHSAFSLQPRMRFLTNREMSPAHQHI